MAPTTKQNETKRNKTKQNETKQNETKRNKPTIFFIINYDDKKYTNPLAIYPSFIHHVSIIYPSFIHHLSINYNLSPP